MMHSMNEDVAKVLFTAEQISEASVRLAKQINKDYAGQKLVVVGLLKGSIPFLAALMNNLEMMLETEYMDVSSYHGGTVSTGEIKILKDLDVSIKDKHILIVEDIVDTGLTLKTVIALFNSRGAKSIEVATLLNKSSGRTVDITPKYIGFEVGNEFVIGFGLDYNEYYRNLPYIGVLKEAVYRNEEADGE